MGTARVSANSRVPETQTNRGSYQPHMLCRPAWRSPHSFRTKATTFWLRCPPHPSTVSLGSKFEAPQTGKLFPCVAPPRPHLQNGDTTTIYLFEVCGQNRWLPHALCSGRRQHQLPGQGFPASAPQTSRRGSFWVGVTLCTEGCLAAPLAAAH